MIRQVSIPGAIPHLAVLAMFVFAGWYISRDFGVIGGAALFLALRFRLRAIPRDHRAGIGLVRQQQFVDAIPYFLRSFEFFDDRRWLDDYRAIFMLSPSSASYREMALANAGFCYSQIGDGVNARKYYERCLELFPDSGIASTALKMLTSGGNKCDAQP